MYPINLWVLILEKIFVVVISGESLTIMYVPLVSHC